MLVIQPERLERQTYIWNIFKYWNMICSVLKLCRFDFDYFLIKLSELISVGVPWKLQKSMKAAHQSETTNKHTGKEKYTYFNNSEVTIKSLQICHIGFEISEFIQTWSKHWDIEVGCHTYFIHFFFILNSFIEFFSIAQYTNNLPILNAIQAINSISQLKSCQTNQVNKQQWSHWQFSNSLNLTVSFW